MSASATQGGHNKLDQSEQNSSTDLISVLFCKPIKSKNFSKLFVNQNKSTYIIFLSVKHLPVILQENFLQMSGVKVLTTNFWKAAMARKVTGNLQQSQQNDLTKKNAISDRSDCSDCRVERDHSGYNNSEPYLKSGRLEA